MAQKISEEQVKQAIEMRQQGFYYPEIAVQLGVNAKTLESRVSRYKPYRDEYVNKRGYETNIANNAKRKAAVERFIAKAEIGKKLIYNEPPIGGGNNPIVKSGTIFYKDGQKIGFINKRGRPEWLSRNDLMPVNVKVAIA